MKFFSKDKNNSFVIVPEELENEKQTSKPTSPDAITPDEISSLFTLEKSDKPQYEADGPSPLDILKSRMQVSEPQSETAKKVETSIALKKDNNVEVAENKPQKTLLQKLQRYTVDEQGRDLSENHLPLYELESVAEILKSDGDKAIEALSKKYNVSVDDLGKTPKKQDKKPQIVSEPQEEKVTTVAPSPTPTPAFEKMVVDSEVRQEEELFEALFPTEEKTELDFSIPDISDIDNSAAQISQQPTAPADTATIRFTPIKDSKGNTGRIAISSVTQNVDLRQEISDDFSNEVISDTTTLHKTDFELFSPKTEMNDLAGGKKLMRILAIKKRSGFLRTAVSAIMSLAILLFALPPLSDFIISETGISMIICGAFLTLSILANIGMFADFTRLFKARSSSDVLASLAAVFTLALTVNAAITSSNAYYIILLCSLIMFMRSLYSFKDVSTRLGNLKQIANSKPKRAVELITDTATTYAMAKDSIEGDVLAAAPRRANFIEDFMKYSQYNTKLSGKTAIIFYITLALCLLSGVAANFYYDSAFHGFYCAAAIACIAAVPILFLIDSLPLASAAKKLNIKGAMIAGIAAAEKLELANAAVISTTDIFPDGAITMHDMKVLENNRIDEILVRAASLTAAVESPLAPIFKSIAGTNLSYSIPDSDTVKYEKRLGLSGWVDNELMFIGNRSLMEAHGIEVPSIEVDKKILRSGYFPVYVATSNTACALLIIQYDVRRDIQKELRRVTELGITLLVNNCDPNVNESMICDYFGLYEDSVKVMTNAGVHMYKNATLPTERCSAPAAFRGRAMSFISIMNSASRIKKSNTILSIMYILSSILGIVYFIYASFSGLDAIPEQSTVLLYELAATVLSGLLFLIKKP